jgi:predicted GTPase
MSPDYLGKNIKTKVSKKANLNDSNVDFGWGELYNNSNSNNNNDIQSYNKNYEQLIKPENISIALLGTVSSGKSTLLNSIFCQELSQSSMKRTTMNPYFFIENDKKFNNLVNPKEINNRISSINKEIVNKTESGGIQKECTEVVFEVGKIDIDILKNQYVNLIDIPGLNDAQTKNIYFKYLRDNFFKFNIVLFLVDIQSGLNTSDEMDILRLIVSETVRESNENNRIVYTLVVVNKCDDLQKNPNGKDQLVLVGELQEMFEQVQNTVKREFETNGISDCLIDIIPLCGIDSFLYRMIKKHGSNYELKETDIVKIGTAEGGKRFSRKSKEEQLIEIKKIISDNDFVDEMIKMSGFSGLENSLKTFFQSRLNISNKLCISNIEYNMRFLPHISKKISEESSIEEISNIIIEYNNLLMKIKKINDDSYQHKLAIFVSNISRGYGSVVVSLNDVKSIKKYYDNMNENINKVFFQDCYDTNTYPSYVCDKIISLMKYEFTNSMITIIDLVFNMNILKDIGCFNKSIVSSIFDLIISNIYEYKTFSFCSREEFNDNIILIVDFFKSVKSEIEDYDFSYFVRFFIINLFESGIFTSDELLAKKIFYQRNGELIIQNYLNFYLSNTNIIKSKIFINGIDDFLLNELDIFYLTI